MDWIWVGFGFSSISFSAGLVGLVILLRRGVKMPRNGRSPSPVDKSIQQARKQAERDEKKRLAAVKRVAKALRPQIIRALARQGFAYIYERQGAMVRSSNPVIRECLFTHEALYYRINQLPFRKTFTELMDPAVTENLSFSIGRECRIVSGVDIGVWVMVGLKSGISAIPKYFPWHDKVNEKNALDLLPKTKPWSLPIGMTENRKFVYDDLRDWPHLIVAGATDGGKSVFLNNLICTMITRLKPENVELLLIDLKGGVEFWEYQDIPHLAGDVIFNPTLVPAALKSVIQEHKRRLERFRKRKTRNIRAWNQIASKRDKLPYKVVIFDEVSSLMLEPKNKQAVEDLAISIAEQGRATGVHIIFCTQYPNANVLTTRIKANVTTRVVFATDENGSMVVLGNHAAAKLPPKTGRMIYRRGPIQMQVQAPFISDEQIKATIAAVAGGEVAAGEQEMTADDLFLFCVQNLNGKFTRRAILEQLNVPEPLVRSVSKQYAYDLARQEPVIDLGVNGRFILTKAPMNGGRGNALFPVNGHLPGNQDELELLVGGEQGGVGELWEDEEE
jgi:hypothetical protein